MPIGHGETIQRILYGIENGYSGQRWNNAMCGLHFITETQTYGPYASECEIQYAVNIPEDITLLEFLPKQLKYIGEKNWVLGFHNEIQLSESKIYLILFYLFWSITYVIY